VAWTRAALAALAAGAVALVLLSGGSSADPRTPAALPGMPPPFLGTAVAGAGGLTAAVDAYGDVVDLRAPGPAGRGLIDNPADRQVAGTVAADTGIVPRVRIGGGRAEPLWRADSISQRYLPGTNVVRTLARFGDVAVEITDAGAGRALARVVSARAPPGLAAVPAIGINLEPTGSMRCRQARLPRRLALVCSTGPPLRPGGSGSSDAGVDGRANPRTAVTRPLGSAAAGVEAQAARIVAAASTGDRRWIAHARPLGPGAPAWAQRLYRRSLLTLRALTDRRTGAVAAGAREGWAYVWPRDAGTAAVAYAASGYRVAAQRVARFLLGLDLGAAARFDGDGDPVPSREAQGDAAGWTALAARAAGLPSPVAALPWRERPDYQEGAPGAYLGNAIAQTVADRPETLPHGGKSAHRRGAPEIGEAFEASGGLVRRARDPASGLDSAAAWAVRPFPLPALFPAVRKSLLRLAARQTRFGITPGEGWPGTDPWTAPTAWSAWSLAALADRERRSGAPGAGDDRRQALRLLADLRRAATPAGSLPERVDAGTGIPRSTTPLAWSHAFAVLALRELWP
jgi:hypothetical protein